MKKSSNSNQVPKKKKIHKKSKKEEKLYIPDVKSESEDYCIEDDGEISSDHSSIDIEDFKNFLSKNTN